MNKFQRTIWRELVFLGYRLVGLDISGKCSFLRRARNWSPDERKQWRLARLNTVIDFAWTHVPFYRQFWSDHNVKRKSLGSLDELLAYPVLTKDVFRSNRDRLYPDNLSSIPYISKHTGGSTSVPVHYFLDRQQWTFMEAFHLWGWSQAGYEFGNPVGVIAGGSLVPERGSWQGRIRGLAHRRLCLYGVSMDDRLARQYHQVLLRHKVEFLYGYPSILYLFAKSLKHQELTIPSLKAVVTTAEMLLPHYRQSLEVWLRCRVFDNLGSNDGGFESYECRMHNGFHYNDLQAVLETLPPEPAQSHGKLLITNLWNRSTPFIRYENGDLVALSDVPCPCGAPFPMISSIQGRTADILSFGNGRSLSGPALTLIFGDMQIDGWQIVQTSPSSIEVRICVERDVPREYSEHILRVLNFHLNHEIAIDIRRVDRLEVTVGGKHKPIMRLPTP